jgi:hypothetical protein
MTNHKSSQRPMLIEKFVKVCLYEGSLMARHPFTIKARGSYFDDSYNVDREKNKDVAWYRQDYRDNHWASSMSEILNDETTKHSENSLSTEPYSDSIEELEESIPPSSLPNARSSLQQKFEMEDEGSKIKKDQIKTGGVENVLEDTTSQNKLKSIEEKTLQSLLTEFKKNQGPERGTDTQKKPINILPNTSISLPLSNANKISDHSDEEIEKISNAENTDQDKYSETNEANKYEPDLNIANEKHDVSNVNIVDSTKKDNIEASESVLSDEEYYDDDEMFDDEDGDPYYRTLEEIRGTEVPMHVLFYGRSHHQVDSYSVDHHGKQQTHLYISSIADSPSHDDGDAVGHQELKEGDHPTARRTRQHRAGNISIWQPRDIYKNGDSADRDEMNHSWCEEDNYRHGFTLYCSERVLNSVLKDRDDVLKTVFLIPTIMSKIDLQCDGTGNVELDAGLIEDLEFTRLSAEQGNVVARDISSQIVKLSSDGGDILLDGVVEGDVSAETKGDGDFIAKNIGGPRIAMTTQDGDITIRGDVKADMSKFHSTNGQISIYGTLSGASEFLQSGKGDVRVKNVTDIGAVLAVVRQGDITITFADNIDLNSTLEVQTGNINITIPAKHKYRINAVGPRVNIASRLLNKGEIFLSEQDGNWRHQNQPMEIFTTSSSTRSEMDDILQKSSLIKNALKEDKPIIPSAENGIATLTVIVHYGSLTINVSQTMDEANVEKGFDSVT